MPTKKVKKINVEEKPISKKKLYESFLAELDSSLIVDEKTRKYWLANYKKLPILAVQYFYNHLVKEDEYIKELISAGLDANPELAEKIIQKGKAVKRKALKYQEKESIEEENPDEFLEAQLKK